MRGQRSIYDVNKQSVVHKIYPIISLDISITLATSSTLPTLYQSVIQLNYTKQHISSLTITKLSSCTALYRSHSAFILYSHDHDLSNYIVSIGSRAASMPALTRLHRFLVRGSADTRHPAIRSVVQRARQSTWIRRPINARSVAPNAVRMRHDFPYSPPAPILPVSLTGLLCLLCHLYLELSFSLYASVSITYGPANAVFCTFS